jgi:hypothetical protein
VLGGSAQLKRRVRKDNPGGTISDDRRALRRVAG